MKYDLLIKNAAVIDGTGREAFFADVAVKDGKIAEIGNDLSDASEIIDASGLMLTPGWIDSHSHSNAAVFAFPDQREKVEQGITFSVTGQCGYSSAPSRDKDGNLFSVRDYFDAATVTPQGSGSVMLVGHTMLRLAVIGSENRAPTREEMELMKKLLRDGMESGALGMSFGLFYAPGAYATVEECVELASVVAEYGGILAAHIRDERDGVIEAVDEFLKIIKGSGCRGVFSHHKSAEPQNFGKVKTTVSMIKEAIDEGYDIYLDVYPYPAYETTLLASFIPQQFHREGIKDVVDLVRDDDSRAMLRKWGLDNWGEDLGFVLVSKCPPYSQYEGLTVNEIAEKMGMDRYECAYELIRASEGVAEGFFFVMDESDIEFVMREPRAMICTDSTVAGKSTRYHPRLRASFPRVLSHYVRERGVTSLPEMIRKMTSLPASVYGLAGKGEIKVGMDADLCIFDYGKIKDRADFSDCTPANEGLSYVIIDGEIVARDGVHNGKRAAKVLRANL